MFPSQGMLLLLLMSVMIPTAHPSDPNDDGRANAALQSSESKRLTSTYLNNVHNNPMILDDPFGVENLPSASKESPDVSGTRSPPSAFDPFKATSYKLKVATLNVWGLSISKNRQSRMDAIARYFTKNPRRLHVLAVQELWIGDDYRTLRSALSLEFPHAHYFKSGMVGSGLAIFSKHPISDAWWHGFTLTGKAHRVFDGDWYAGKGIGAVRIRHPVVGNIDIFNSHLIANYSPQDYEADWYKSHRATQFYELVRHVDKTSDPSSYTIVMGDLNTQPVEDIYQAIIRGHDLYTSYRRPLRNVWRDISKGGGGQSHAAQAAANYDSPLNQQDPDQWSQTTMQMSATNRQHYTCNLRTNSYFNSAQPEQQIDHILYVPDGRMKCLEAAVFLTHPTRDASGTAGPSYSDHAAVMAVFEIRPSDQVLLNNRGGGERRHSRKKHHVSDATRKLMVRLNEDIQALYSQQWSYRLGAIICCLFVLGFVIGAIVLLKRANSSEEMQKRLTIASDPQKYKWHERISLNWFALLCLVIVAWLCMYCQWLIWHAMIFLSQEIFAFKEFQYEWALWLRKH